MFQNLALGFCLSSRTIVSLHTSPSCFQCVSFMWMSSTKPPMLHISTAAPISLLHMFSALPRRDGFLCSCCPTAEQAQPWRCCGDYY